ncbi:MAG: hypothetical protein IIZ13_13430 [Renibacterium sp.]|nr:hypothetical protein [Renibacterium sp.]
MLRSTKYSIDRRDRQPGARQPVLGRPRPGWRIAGHALLLSASLFLAWFGFVFHVFQWDISY